ncbi:MAG: radical SAM protein [Magnetococcales bacterium]|nr:radical SAM protein [Magnetococcales bacterium]
MNSKTAIKIDADILLVIPIRPGYSGILPDLGLLYLYSALRDHDLSVAILHCPKEGIVDFAQWDAVLSANRHLKIVGFKSMSHDHNFIKKMAAAVKQYMPDCVTIAGGPHVTSLPEYVLQDMSPMLDYGFNGEGEIGFPKFCQSILNNKIVPSLVPGLVWRNGDKVNINARQVVADLDKLPRIRWEDIDLGSFPKWMSSLPFIPIMATRGCPFECTYCSAPTIVGRKMRYRSVENVLAELQHLKKVHGVGNVTFVDDELTINRRFFQQLCQGMIDSKLDLKWEANNGVRLDTLHEDNLELMYQAGCRYIAVGIESASEEILEKVKKKISIQTIREKVALVKRSKVVPQGLFMIGFPGETEQQINSTINFAIELDIDKTNFSIFMPLPGTASFNDMVAGGYLDLAAINWDDMKPDRTVFERPGCSSKRLKKLQRKAYWKFYMRPKPLGRLIHEFGFKSGGLGQLFSKIRSVFG